MLPGLLSLLVLFIVHDGTPLQYSCLENPMDGGPWWAAVHGVATSRTRLNNFTFTFHFHALGKEMATQSSVVAWRIPGTAEPGELLSMGSHRVGHDWSDLATAALYMKWTRQGSYHNLWKWRNCCPVIYSLVGSALDWEGLEFWMLVCQLQPFDFGQVKNPVSFFSSG